jgi:hypothetical protein
MNTTLGQVKPGDEILQISQTPAAKVTVGVPWTDDEPQRLVVATAYTAQPSRMMILTFTNGGKHLPVHADVPCVISDAD